MSECTVCAASVTLQDNTEVGEIIECGDCQSELEVVSLNPVKMEKAPEEEEDWGE